jgi:hypothetical protein
MGDDARFFTPALKSVTAVSTRPLLQKNIGKVTIGDRGGFPGHLRRTQDSILLCSRTATKAKLLVKDFGWSF